MSCRVLSWLAAFRCVVFRLISENVKTKAHRTVNLRDFYKSVELGFSHEGKT